jgi:CheY-like chemotaxis protein
MRCLLVEDEPDRVARLLPELKKIFGDTGVDVVADRDSAMAIVERTAFDLVVLDQRIPTGPGQLDGDVIHGRAVLDHVRQVAPDTPVYFLTGLPMEEDYVDRLIEEGMKCDVWGDRKPVALIRRFQKATMTPFYEAASQIAGVVRVTDDIEINLKGANLDLSSDEIRLLRVFTRLHDGVCADVVELSPGFSGARVLRADVKDAQGGIRLSVASKLGRYDAIASEIERYEREVVRLPAGTYAPLIPGKVARVVESRGAFYRLLDGYDRCYFDVLKESDANAALCAQAIRDGQLPWAQNAKAQKMRVGDLVKMLVWETYLPAIHELLDGIDWKGFEDREITVNICTRHGDLHGENALVDAKHRAMMIDYGAVGPLPSAIDAVTLELSPFFHPHGFRAALRWNTEDGAIDWFDRDAFCTLSTIPEHIKAARQWAHGDGFGEREVLACAYTYVLRQLQFPGADKNLALAFVTGIVGRALKA